MVNRIAFGSLVPMTASVLIHLGVAAAVVLGQGWAPAAMPVLVAELVEAEAPHAVEPPPPPKPTVRARRPVMPPRPIATPLPFDPPAAARPEPEPPDRLPEPQKPVAPEPPKLAAPGPPAVPTPVPEARRPVASAPAQIPGPPVAAGPSAPRDAPDDSNPDPGAFMPVAPLAGGSAEPPAPSSARGPAAAAIAANGITQRAIPRGGYQYRPAYPSRARSLGVQGTTLLHVLVSDRGRVAEVVVKQSAGHPDLDQAAADAVRRWRFEPALRGTEPVQMWVQLPFEFRLR